MGGGGSRWYKKWLERDAWDYTIRSHPPSTKLHTITLAVHQILDVSVHVRKKFIFETGSDPTNQNGRQRISTQNLVFGLQAASQLQPAQRRGAEAILPRVGPAEVQRAVRGLDAVDRGPFPQVLHQGQQGQLCYQAYVPPSIVLASRLPS